MSIAYNLLCSGSVQDIGQHPHLSRHKNNTAVYGGGLYYALDGGEWRTLERRETVCLTLAAATMYSIGNVYRYNNVSNGGGGIYFWTNNLPASYPSVYVRTATFIGNSADYGEGRIVTSEVTCTASIGSRGQ